MWCAVVAAKVVGPCLDGLDTSVLLLGSTGTALIMTRVALLRVDGFAGIVAVVALPASTRRQWW